jgi:hypothetical protein
MRTDGKLNDHKRSGGDPGNRSHHEECCHRHQLTELRRAGHLPTTGCTAGKPGRCPAA